MQRATLRLLITFGLTFGLWFTTAWAVQDGQEAICDSSAIMICDNFDARPPGVIPSSGGALPATYKNNGWSSDANNVTCVHSIVTGIDPTGATSNFFQMHYTDYNNGANVGCGSALAGVGFSPFTTEAYYRVYAKYSSNFVWSPAGNKFGGMYFGSGNDGFNLGNSFGDGVGFAYYNLGLVPAYDCNVGWPVGSLNGYDICQHLNGPPQSYGHNVWHCIEWHVKMNTNKNFPSDGITEMWIDGVQKIGRYDVSIVAWPGTLPGGGGTNPSDWFFTGMNIYGRWQCFNGVDDGMERGCLFDPQFGGAQPATHPIQDRWIDNIVMSRQRIGCLGTTPPPSDTSPPAAPSSLRISSLWDQFWKVFSTLAGLLG